MPRRRPTTFEQAMGPTFIRRLLLLAALISLTAWPAAAEGNDRPWLGVTVMNAGKEWPEDVGGKVGGALVARVVERGPAAGAAIRPGDVIVAVDSKTVRNTRELACLVQGRKPGDTVHITLLRRGARHIATAELGRWPDTPPPRADCGDAIS
jgi:S1-C subfamily serine protease